MAELKTKETKASVAQFIKGIADDTRRRDTKALVAMMRKATNAKPVMWGPSIIGFGDHQYTNSTRKPIKWFQAGFSPRKAALSVYLMGGWDKTLLKKLTGHSTSHSCLYIKNLDDVDRTTLQKLIDVSVKNLRKKSKSN